MKIFFLVFKFIKILKWKTGRKDLIFINKMEIAFINDLAFFQNENEWSNASSKRCMKIFKNENIHFFLRIYI